MTEQKKNVPATTGVSQTKKSFEQAPKGIWRNANGEEVAIKDMTNQHLMLSYRALRSWRLIGDVIDKCMELEDEIVRRDLTAFVMPPKVN